LWPAFDCFEEETPTSKGDYWNQHRVLSSWKASLRRSHLVPMISCFAALELRGRSGPFAKMRQMKCNPCQKHDDDVFFREAFDWQKILKFLPVALVFSAAQSFQVIWRH